MKIIPISVSNQSFTYLNEKYTMLSMRRNYYSGLWSFDLQSPDGTMVRGIVISGGTNVLDGLGTGIPSLVFIDLSTNTGDIVNLNQTKAVILEEGETIF